MQTIRLGDIRYNPRAGAFEARVDVVREGTTFRYPCQVSGPVDMDDGYVRDRLKLSALRMSDSGANLRSVTH